MPLHIEKMLVMSTAHVCKETADMLDDEDSDLHEMLVIYPHGERGWLIYTQRAGSCLIGDLPEDLERCRDFAHRLECKWFLLDRDGPVESFLEEYSW